MMGCADWNRCLTIVPGAIVLGILAYLVAWFIMPNSPSSRTVVTPSVA